MVDGGHIAAPALQQLDVGDAVDGGLFKETVSPMMTRPLAALMACTISLRDALVSLVPSIFQKFYCHNQFLLPSIVRRFV